MPRNQTFDEPRLQQATANLGKSRESETGFGMSNLQDAAEAVEEFADDVQKTARVTSRYTQRAARNGLVSVEEAIKEQPLLAVGAATLLGIALGALWKAPNFTRSRGWTDQAYSYVEPHYRSLRRHF